MWPSQVAVSDREHVGQQWAAKLNLTYHELKSNAPVDRFFK